MIVKRQDNPFAPKTIDWMLWEILQELIEIKVNMTALEKRGC